MKILTSELHGICSLFRYGSYHRYSSPLAHFFVHSLGFAICIVTPSPPATSAYLAAHHPSTHLFTTHTCFPCLHQRSTKAVSQHLFPMSVSTLHQSWSFHRWLTKGDYAQWAQVQDDKKHCIIPLVSALSSPAPYILKHSLMVPPPPARNNKLHPPGWYYASISLQARSVPVYRSHSQVCHVSLVLYYIPNISNRLGHGISRWRSTSEWIISKSAYRRYTSTVCYRFT
jgi:hypothetical protein